MQQPTPQPNVLSSGIAPELSLRFWLLLLATGIGAGIGGGLLMKLLHFVEHSAWSYHSGNFLEGIEATSPVHRIAVLLGAGVLGAVGLWAIRHFTSEEGGGLTGAIWFDSGRLPTVKSVASGALSIVLVGLGISLGREAAPKEVAAALASRLCQRAKVSRAQRRLLVACGAGAGMAAVYNVPFGGAIFALEVLLGTMALPLVLPAIATSFVATAVSWIFLPAEPTYSVPVYPLTFSQILWAIVAGPLIGLASVPYVRAISWAGTHKPKAASAVLLPVVVFAGLGALAIPFPQLLGNGKDTVQLAFLDQISVPLLGALLILKPLMTTACLRTGAPGGLFTPTMTCGALMGSLLGHAWSCVWPGTPIGSYALIGAAAILGAAMEGPISAIVFVLELTHSLTPLMVPTMLAVAGATLVARALESRSIYSGRGRVEKPALPKAMDSSAAINKEAVISGAAPYATVLERLVTLPEDRVLYVVDQHRKLLGVISAQSLDLSVREYGDPRQTATASDLAIAMEIREASYGLEETDKELLSSSGLSLPIAEGGIGRLRGVKEDSD